MRTACYFVFSCLIKRHYTRQCVGLPSQQDQERDVRGRQAVCRLRISRFVFISCQKCGVSGKKKWSLLSLCTAPSSRGADAVVMKPKRINTKQPRRDGRPRQKVRVRDEPSCVENGSKNVELAKFMLVAKFREIRYNKSRRLHCLF